MFAHVGDVIKWEISIWGLYSPMKYKIGNVGLNAVLKPYQIEIIKYLWAYPDNGKSSKQIYDAVKEKLPDGKTISRTSIIISLNTLVADGVVMFQEITDRRSRRRVYKSKFDESGYKRHIIETLLLILLEEFPEETKKIFSDMN